MNIIELYDAKSAIDIIFIDFQNAFDAVSHKRFAIKFRSIGLRGERNNWI